MIVYKITNRINGKVYIGQTTRSLEKRWKEHCQLSHGCQLMYRAIIKHGKENFTVEQIDVACTREELDAKEVYWIKFYDSMNRNKGYNLDSGGNKCKKRSPETIVKLINANKGRWAGEKNPKFGKGHLFTGQNNSFYGKKHTDETKKKLSAKIKGRTLSEEWKKKIGDAERGEKHWLYGKHQSEEVKRKISETKKGKYGGSKNPRARAVVCIETGEVFKCGLDACLKYRLARSTLCCHLRGRNKTCGGYHWRYVDD